MVAAHEEVGDSADAPYTPLLFRSYRSEGWGPEGVSDCALWEAGAMPLMPLHAGQGREGKELGGGCI